MAKQSNRVLFLCSGNYYRSRFAEALFNALASEANLSWVADSCGLVVDRPNNNKGPIAAQTVAALKARGITASGTERLPLQVEIAHLEEADLVIAMKEAEHRPLFVERFPEWENRVEYWHIHDLDQASAQEALDAIENQIRDLISRLQPQR